MVSVHAYLAKLGQFVSVLDAGYIYLEKHEGSMPLHEMTDMHGWYGLINDEYDTW